MSNLNFKNRTFFHPKTKEPILFDENKKNFSIRKIYFLKILKIYQTFLLMIKTN